MYAYKYIYTYIYIYLTIAKCCYIATCIVFCTKYPYLRLFFFFRRDINIYININIHKETLARRRKRDKLQKCHFCRYHTLGIINEIGHNCY